MNSTGLLTLSEFRRIAGISHAELNRLLELGMLPLTLDDSGQLKLLGEKIDPKLLSPQQLEDSKALFTSKRDLLEEIIASTITQALDTVVDEAIELALSWKTPEDEKSLPPESDESSG